MFDTAEHVYHVWNMFQIVDDGVGLVWKTFGMISNMFQKSGLIRLLRLFLRGDSIGWTTEMNFRTKP